MHRIEALLRKRIGLDPASIGSSLIERTVRLRMKQRGLKHLEEYQQQLQDSAEEFDELVEAVVVTETWFFRDRGPFQAFAQMAIGDWLPNHPEAVMRILSVPCSSGEEPYSLAMGLLDGGVPPERFQIEAVDISQSALARATRAVYGKNSFRGPDLGFRDRHFSPVRDGFALSPSVRQLVAFRRENILGDAFLSESTPYDFIFCRNLLIYFDRATRVAALARLHRLLTNDGMLFVGPAELPLVMESGFSSANLPHAFACRKANGAATAAAVSPRRKRRGTSLAKPIGQLVKINLPPVPAVSGNGGPPATNHNVSSLLLARRLADSGQLAEAAELCRTHLLQHQDCTEAYYLLGLVKDAADDPTAIEFYRKALYLNPNHYEALVHAALWLERTGDTKAARTFKRRAERAQPRTNA